MSSLGSNKLVSGVIIIIVMVFLFFSFSSYEIVESGTVGIVTHFGAVQEEILPEGLHLITPVKTTIVSLNVRVQKVEVKASASSKDLQVVTSTVALNFFLSKEKANIIFQELGIKYHDTIIHPTIQESVKSATAQFTAEELITKRPKVKEKIFEDVKQRLAVNNIIVTDFSIINFNFSPEFNKAIEEKQVAEQRALRAKNDLERIKIEAEQAKAKAAGEALAKLENAKAEAESQRLLRKTLSPQIITLRTIEKWDGVLPTVMGDSGSGAFYDIVGAIQKGKGTKGKR